MLIKYCIIPRIEHTILSHYPDLMQCDREKKVESKFALELRNQFGNSAQALNFILLAQATTQKLGLQYCCYIHNNSIANYNGFFLVILQTSRISLTHIVIPNLIRSLRAKR